MSYGVHTFIGSWTLRSSLAIVAPVRPTNDGVQEVSTVTANSVERGTHRGGGGGGGCSTTSQSRLSEIVPPAMPCPLSSSRARSAAYQSEVGSKHAQGRLAKELGAYPRIPVLDPPLVPPRFGRPDDRLDLAEGAEPGVEFRFAEGALRGLDVEDDGSLQGDK